MTDLHWPLAGWVRLTGRMPPAELEQVGPVLPVRLGAPGVAPAEASYRALLDTGASRSCLAPGIAGALALPLVGSRRVHPAGTAPRDVLAHRVTAWLPGNTALTLEVAVLDSLDGTADLLLGRDALRLCRLFVDGTAGTYELHVARG